MHTIPKAARHGWRFTASRPKGFEARRSAAGRFGTYVSFADDPFRPKQRRFYRNILLEREGRRLLRTEAGSSYYEEHRNGHALLVCRGTVLPRSVCGALYRSFEPLDGIVELPKDSVILAGNPTIIRAEAKRGGMHLLLRVAREPLPEQVRRFWPERRI